MLTGMQSKQIVSFLIQKNKQKVEAEERASREKVSELEKMEELIVGCRNII
jgi:hypothetical protein